jgi:hypothetical protein
MNFYSVYYYAFSLPQKKLFFYKHAKEIHVKDAGSKIYPNWLARIARVTF